MFFRKKKKELELKEINQIVEDYSKVLRETIGKYLPRRERRAMGRGKGRMRPGSSVEKEEIEQIKKKGVASWLNQVTEEALNELSSIIPDFTSLQSELRNRLKDFKKKWKIK